MARIAGINLPKEKRVPIALTYITGIGRASAEAICLKLKIDTAKKLKDITEDELNAIRAEMKSYVLEGDLRREVAMNIKRKQEINCYVGMRHSKGLPVRGQLTKTNARTRKGKRRTVANKKKVTK
ncbi:30S ribosomal protein S13 [bacterium]|nr:30S ribosomal protein S13 [bacterium]|tara:strand:+ start:6045 stop:6419 length:375 start_codon:yes stop_codon:yes gene_type:complete